MPSCNSSSSLHRLLRALVRGGESRLRQFASFGGTVWRRGRPAWERAIDLVYPPQCVGCGAEIDVAHHERTWCASCLDLLARSSRPYCSRCGTTLAPFTSAPCLTCETEIVRFDHVVRMGAYEGELRSFVLRMKHVSDEPLSMAIGNLLAAETARQLSAWAPDIVIPIPMHWLRRTVRRTSSADLLAAAIGHRLRIPVYPRLLRRHRNTRPQGDLNARERRANVRHAFRLRRPIRVQDQRVLLVDDVLTTGATLNEAARVLSRAGASEIAAVVVARTEGPFV